MRVAALACLVALPAAAEPHVHASLSADLTGDGFPELAVVVGERDLALAIWSEDRDTYRMELLGHAAAIGWTQLGEDARLEVTEAGSLRLTTSNFGIGRNKWEQVLTIAWRDGAFRVAGLTHSGFDTLDLEAGQHVCDLNLLTRTRETSTAGPEGYIRERSTVHLDISAPKLEDWHPEMFGRVCGW